MLGKLETQCIGEAVQSARNPKLDMKKKVMLFYPPYDAPSIGEPLLPPATRLPDAGFRVPAIDGAIVPNFKTAMGNP